MRTAARFKMLAALLLGGLGSALPGFAQGESYTLVTNAPNAEELRNYPLGPVGAQYRIANGGNYARLLSLESGGPGHTAGLLPGDVILGTFGKTLPVAGMTPNGLDYGGHYGVNQELGFAVDRAEGADGQLPLMVLRPGLGLTNITVQLPVRGAYNPAWPYSTPKFDSVYQQAISNGAAAVVNGNGDVGYNGAWVGLALLGYPGWDATNGHPYRTAINKMRDHFIYDLNRRPYAPVEDYLYDGTRNTNHAGGMSQWWMGGEVMFLAEYYDRMRNTDDTNTLAQVRAALQRGVEMCANVIQWWKQPSLLGPGGYSPDGPSIAGMTSHGGVTGDYIHLGWGGGINICGVHTFMGFSFARRAGMDMTVRPRDGHYFGFSNADFASLIVTNGPLHNVVEAGKEYYDHSIEEKFLMQWNMLGNRNAAYSNPNDRNDAHVCYQFEGWNPGEAVGKTAATLVGMMLYQQDGGVLSATDSNRLARMRTFITRNYMNVMDSHAFCVGAQAMHVLAIPFLDDRQQRFILDNWRFYHALARDRNGRYAYYRSRYVNDNYLGDDWCAAVNAMFPGSILRGGLKIIPGLNTNRLHVRLDNPDLRWPLVNNQYHTRYVEIATNVLSVPVAVHDGLGHVLNPAAYSLAWTKLSGVGNVIVAGNQLTFDAAGLHEVKVTVSTPQYTVEEPIQVIVRSQSPPAGYAAGVARFELFSGIDGTTVPDFTNHWKYPDFPDSEKTVSSASGTWGQNWYGARLSGVIIPPVSGSYRFYVTADDTAQLRLNLSGNAGSQGPVVASLAAWANDNEWTKYPSQQSAPFTLAAGVPVGFEALGKIGVGWGLSVGWSINGGPIQTIPGYHLARPAPAVPPMTILAQPATIYATLGSSNQLSIATAGPMPALYQWRRNGVPIPGATSPTLQLPDLSAGSAGSYDCTYTTVNGTMTSRKAWVFITDVGEVVQGGLWREVYTGIGGSTMDLLTNNAKFPYSPDASMAISSTFTPSYGDSYGQRWSGWLSPTNSGNYRFYLASDDNSELWLGTNHLLTSATRILQLGGWTGEREWTARSPSAYVPLTAGQRYYIEVRHKEGGGGDHCALAWQREGTAAPANGTNEISSAFLSYRNGGIYPDTILTNVPPFFIEPPLVRPPAYATLAYAGASLNLSAADTNATDILGLSYAKVAGPAWLSVAPNGALSGTPGPGDVGTNLFTVRATDPGGLATATTLQITVYPVNHAPAFAANPIVVTGAVAYVRLAGQSLAPLASDPDAWASLAFSKVAGPAWLVVAQDGTLSGVPAYTNSGLNTFTVRVTDEGGLSADATLQISVLPATASLLVNGTAPGTNPLTGFFRGQTLPLSVAVIRGYSVVTNVRYFNGGSPIGSANSPFAFNWTSLPAGTHVLTAQVRTSHGDVVTDPVSIVVEYAPVVSNLTCVASARMTNGALLGTVAVDLAPGRTLTSLALVDGDPSGLVSLNAAGELRLAQPSSLPSPGLLFLRVRATDSAGITSAVNGDGLITLVCNPVPAEGIHERRWSGATAYNATNWTGTPAYSGTLPSFTPAQNVGDNYSRRLTGYLMPPATGDYVFWIASDDGSRLYLSPGEQESNKVFVASLNGYTGFQNWNGGAKSTTNTLQAGKLYFLEVNHQEGGGGDHVSVAWEGPGLNRQPIPASAVFPPPVSRLAWLELHSPAPTTNHLAGVPLAIGATVVRGASPLSAVEFYRDTTLLGTSTNAPYALNWNTPTPGSYLLTARALTADGAVTSAPVSLTVLPNSNPLVDADGDGFTTGVEDAAGSDPFVASSFPTNSVYTGLRAFWRMNDGAGAAVSDVTGNGYTGTASNPAWTPGLLGTALALSGSNTAVFGTGPAITGTSDVAISTWVKVNPGSPGGVILQQREPGGSGYIGQYKLSVNANGTVGFFLYGNTFQFSLTSTGTVNNGQWRHLVALRQGTEGRVYIDGTLSASGSGAIQSLNALTVYLGYDGRDNISYFQGLIDELRLYGRALGTQEISYLTAEPYLLPFAPQFVSGTLIKPQATINTPYAASLAGDASDFNAPAGELLSFSKVSGPAWLSVAGNGTLSGTPAGPDLGTNVWTVRVTDSTARFADASLVIVVGNGVPPNYWSNPAGGSWTNAANWFAGSPASGRDTPADFAQLSLSANATVTLDGARTIGGLVFADASGAARTWTLNTGGGGPLTLAVSNGLPVLHTTVGAAINAVLAGTNGLAKTGPGTLTLSALNTVTGGTLVQGGVLALARGSTGGESAVPGAFTIQNNATLRLAAQDALGWTSGNGVLTLNPGGTVTIDGTLRQTLRNTVTMTGGTLAATGPGDVYGNYSFFQGVGINATSDASGNPAVVNAPRVSIQNTGPLPLHVTRGPANPASDLTISSLIADGMSGSVGTILKLGNGILTLTGTNAHRGGATISNGTLLVNGFLPSNGTVRVEAGVLGGTGTIAAPVIVNGTLAPGVNGAGLLTVNNTLTLAGTASFSLHKTNGSLANTRVQGATAVTAGGVLSVSTSGEPLALGDSFKLFNVAPTGAFTATNLPALDNGLSWQPSNNFQVLTVVGANQPQTIAAFIPIAPQTYSPGATVTVTPPAASSGLPVTVSVLSGPATLSGQVVTLTGAGTVVLAANQPGNGFYAPAPEVTTSFLVHPAPAVVTLTSLAQTYNGTARPVTATTTPTNLTVTVTYNGSVSVPTNAGSYTVVGTINDANYTGGATNTLMISKATAVVMLTSLTQTYNGTARPVTATTTPTNLTVAITYNGSATVPTNAGSYTVVGTINDANYTSGATNTLMISKATAVVTLTSLAQTYNGTARAVTATTTPTNLTVAITYNGSATVPTNAGSYTVVGTINDANYTGGATNTLVVSKALASVTLTNLSQPYTGSARPVTVLTSPTNLGVTITYNGTAAAPTNVGSYAVVATVTEVNYAGSATNTLVITSPTPPVLGWQRTAGALQFNWTGTAVLQVMTNTGGFATNWVDYPDGATSPVSVPISPSSKAVYFRLRTP